MMYFIINCAILESWCHICN